MLPLDVLHHEDDDGESVDGEEEEDAELGIAVVPSHPSLFLSAQKMLHAIGRTPRLAGKVRLAPAFISVQTQSRWPSWQAASNGVNPP